MDRTEQRSVADGAAADSSIDAARIETESGPGAPPGDAAEGNESAEAAAPIGGGWNLVWSDEFDGPGVDTTVWNVANSASRVNGELEFYTSRTGASANVFIENGALVLEARQESYQGRNYTSGKIDSSGTRAFQYGRFEARMQLPAETGMWPAFWLLGTDFPTVGWPDCGEVDVMEEKGRLPDIVYSSLHHGPTQDVVQTQSYQLGSGTFHDGWHVVALEWDAAQLQWSVDGTPFFTILKGNASAATWPFDQPFFVILDLAVGGRFDANLAPPANMPPQRLYVDYVRVYQKM